jgi:hypothetical protein
MSAVGLFGRGLLPALCNLVYPASAIRTTLSGAIDISQKEGQRKMLDASADFLEITQCSAGFQKARWRPQNGPMRRAPHPDLASGGRISSGARAV